MKRPFRGLREREPRRRYDAVVIGAGVGGLVCANLLARAGMAVLLVEQHYMVGGYCSTFKRRGYTFDAATHFYPLLGNPDTLTGKLLVQLGVDCGWIRMDPVDTFHLPDGSRFTVPADLDRYLARLKAEFPAEQTAIDSFFVEVRSAYLSGLLAYFRDRETPRMRSLAGITLRQALDQHFQDERLKLVLTADCPHWGSPPQRTSFVFDSMLRLSYFLGNYYPRGGSQAFADALAQRFEQLGGDILMSTRAERIEVADGRATGVVLETTRGALAGRRTVAAGTVVSNADLLLTYEQMLGRQVVGEERIAALRRLRPSYPCFVSHIGLSGVSAERLEEIQGYYWRRWNPDQVGRDALVCKIFAPTLYEPAMAPDGGQIVLLQKVLAMDYDAVTDWQAHKLQIEGAITRHLASLVPNLADRIVVQTSATARTSERFTLNHAGAMLGWEMSPEQLGAGRPGIEGPVDGLYLVGHWVRPGGGITPVIVSAMQAAERITGERWTG
jgi:phytoene desaturase